MLTTVLGVALLVVGGWAAVVLARPWADAPPAGWHPDPAGTEPGGRYWDGQAWTPEIGVGFGPAERARPFRGRFRGRWVWLLVAAVATCAGVGALYLATESTVVLASMSAIGMALACAAFYGFVRRQLALGDVISAREVAAIAVAAAGAVLLIALPLNELVIGSYGLTVGLATVGPIEEGTKLVVPVGLYLLSRHRDPRAGIAAGLASGFGFAIAETTLYAFTLPLGGAPDPCTGATLAAPGPIGALVGQLYRIALISPLHWLWTGIATAVLWRQWRLHGALRATPAAVGALLFVIATHSLNDSGIAVWCGAGPIAQLVRQAIGLATPLVLYLIFRFAARQSTPPQLIGTVSAGWTPTRLGRYS